ncbi:hypothetical protein FRC08_009729 [Ceratobasidium sp. 394]|nr:hypothetical protein FRC08_009729 [Ceratobasidium sp. 394]
MLRHVVASHFPADHANRMRDMYGKLMYLLMDAQSRDVHQLLGFSVVAPIVTVHSTLAQHGALAVLDDPRVTAATQDIPISPNSTNINRATVQEMVREKGRATEAIIAEYSGGETSESAFRATRDEIEKDRLQLSSGNPGAEDKTPPPEPMTSDLLRQCIYSINDYNTFLRTTREPCEIMIGYLKKYFSPNGSGHERDEYPSLTIKTGRDGAKLDHDHPKQYSYVLQSLNLWKETIESEFLTVHDPAIGLSNIICLDLPKLWYFAESDLLAPNGTYRFENTGQGWNRVQYAPKASQEMHAILRRAQRDFRSWIGSSVIHIGDHDVPNALFFIDKYCQIYRILWPITNVLAQIPIQGKVQEYAAHEFGSADGAIREILADFFKHAFDGSGAESYSHAGRCVDGSLTSGKYQASFLPTL